jgi:type I restriction enzyme S subunit
MNSIAIGDVSEIVLKSTTPTSVGLSFSTNGIPFLKGEDVLGKAIDLPKVSTFISEESHRLLNRSELVFGDVLITIAGTIGRIGFIDDQSCIANCNQAVAFVRSGVKKIDPEWLCYLLQSPIYQTKFTEFVAGGAIPNVSLQQIRSIELPDISIEKQRQIAARLKAQLAEVDKAHQAAETQLRETTKLADAVVFDSIRRGKTTRHNLGEVLHEVKQGIGENWVDYPVLGATRDGLAPAKEPPGKKPQRYKPVFPGTVFYNPMLILIGSIALLDYDDTPGITSPDYVALQGKPGVVDSRWFYYWLRSPLGEQCILSLARGAVRERMLFNRLADGEIELPDFSIQQKASAALAALKPMRQAIESKINDINLLPQKILAQAFGDACP